MDTLKIAKMFLVLGDLTSDGETREQKLAYEEKIVFSTMKSLIPDWQIPPDWSDITIDQKEERLKKLREVM